MKLVDSALPVDIEEINLATVHCILYITMSWYSMHGLLSTIEFCTYENMCNMQLDIARWFPALHPSTNGFGFLEKKAF